MKRAEQLFIVSDHLGDNRSEPAEYGSIGTQPVEVDFLHFETCYYQGIDYCIANGIPHFDAGAQGEHKLARGFVPQFTHSYHYLAEPGFNDAIKNFCEAEAQQIEHYMQWAETALPYKAE